MNLDVYIQFDSHYRYYRRVMLGIIVFALLAIAGAITVIQSATMVTVNTARVVNLRVGNLTFYVHPTGNDSNPGTQSQPWQTWAKAVSSAPSGSIVDGQNQVYYDERCVLSRNNVMFRNFVLDGTVPITGMTSVSGEIYKGTTTGVVCQMIEDGVMLTPLLCTDQGDVVANLARGQFSQLVSSNAVYYRASDGLDPSTHALRIPSQTLAATYDFGILKVYSATNVTIQNVTVRNGMSRNYLKLSVFENCANLNVTNLTNIHGMIGCDMHGCINSTFNINCLSNADDGFIQWGYITNNTIIGGDYIWNGRMKTYNATNYDYIGDLDGVAPGQSYLFGIGLTFDGCNISSNGPPDSATNAYGSGLYVETTAGNMLLNNLTVKNCRIVGNHGVGLRANNQVSGMLISNNIVAYSGAIGGANGLSGLVITHTNGGTTTIVNNLIEGNYGTNYCGALSLYVSPTSTVGMVTLTNNCFYNNGNATRYDGDLYWRAVLTGHTNILENYNTIQRVGAWGVTKAAFIDPATIYNLNELATYQSDNGQGANDTWTTVGPRVNPTTLTWP